MNATNVQNAWLNAEPGELITLDQNIGRLTLAKSKRPKLSAPVAISLNGFDVGRDPVVGSSDTLLLKSGLRDIVIDGYGGTLLGCSRSGIKTEGPAGARNVLLKRMRVYGGWDASTNVSEFDCKWLSHHWLTGSWKESQVDYLGCSDEHARYLHSIQGNHIFSGGSAKWCQLTALQIVNRMKEVSDPYPVGYGDVTVQDEVVEDVCLAQGGGGWAYSFRGGMPTSDVVLQRVKGRLGCNVDLHPTLRGRATGLLLMDSGKESSPGAGDAAHPGGTHSLSCIDVDFETESAYDGTGSAERSCAKVGEVGLFYWLDGRIVVPKGDIALEITASCKEFIYGGAPEVVGKVKYKGVVFNDWNGFALAHPECKE